MELRAEWIENRGNSKGSSGKVSRTQKDELRPVLRRWGKLWGGAERQRIGEDVRMNEEAGEKHK